MEFLEIKQRFDGLHQQVTDLASDMKVFLMKISDDTSAEATVQKASVIMLNGVIVALMACLRAAGQIMETADVHERTRGEMKQTGMTI